MIIHGLPLHLGLAAFSPLVFSWKTQWETSEVISVSQWVLLALVSGAAVPQGPGHCWAVASRSFPLLSLRWAVLEWLLCPRCRGAQAGQAQLL